ncbi:hypothetical protein CKK33_01975 [Mucilaginibacter sp. MD40]|nr:hypothetical protein CKK33_01975 [Mucilaginibacter sp. MD40]
MRDQETPAHITGIRSSKGQIILNIFRTAEEYDKQQPFKTESFSKTNLRNGELNIRVNLSEGIYGFTMIDDENGNGKLDKNFIGVPKEGFGFSNYFMEKLRKPAFNDFKIDLAHTPSFGIRVKYM